MADQFGIDLGNAFQRAEEIQAARIANQFRPALNQLAVEEGTQMNALRGLQLQEAQQGLADENALRSARGAALTEAGVTGPKAEIAIISPAEAAKVQDYVAGLDEEGRKKAAEQIDRMGRIANYVLNAEDPAAAYADALELIPEKDRAGAPKEYDEKWVKLQLGRATALNDLFGETEDLIKNAPSGYRFTNKDRNELRPIKGGPQDPATKGESGLKTTQSNAIRSTVTSQFGGTYDPQTGAIVGLDPTQAERALAVMADAEAFLIADGAIGIAQAVQKAMAKNPGSKTEAAPAGDDTNVDENDPLDLGL